MTYRQWQQLVRRFFEHNDLLFGQVRYQVPGRKPSTRKKGHYEKELKRRRRRNKIARQSRRSHR